MRGTKILRNMLGMDWRSLALLRIGLAAIVLIDLSICVRHLSAFYSDDGVLPRTTLLQYNDPTYCIYLAGGSVWLAGALIALEATLALMMLVGYRTRLATVGCWYMLLARQARNPLLLFGPDMMLMIMFFWAMFLPLGRRFSLDAALGRTRRPEEPVYAGVPSFVYLAQFIVIYVMSSLMKTGVTWQGDHTAVSYALSLDMYSKPLGQWLNQYDGLTRVLTVAVVYVEFYAPFLLILPFWTRWGRLLGFAMLAALQIGFGLCMSLGLFGIVMVVIMFPFLPDEFWKYFAEPLGRRLAAMVKKFRAAPEVRERLQGWWRRWQLREQLAVAQPGFVVSCARKLAGPLRILRNAVLLFLIGYVALYNIDGTPANTPPHLMWPFGRLAVLWNPKYKPLVPTWLDWIAPATGLDQQFGMFTPDPQMVDGWFVLYGTLANGDTVDLMNGGPADFTRPASPIATYGDQRWASILIDLWHDEYSAYLPAFAYYMGTEWNKTHTGDQHLKTLEIIFMDETVVAPRVRQAVTPETLYTQSFD